MNGLIIRSAWVELILNGKKTWEIRGHATRMRGKIALIRGGSGSVVGTCEVTGAIGPLTLAELRKNAGKAGFAERLWFSVGTVAPAFEVKNPKTIDSALLALEDPNSKDRERKARR